MLSRGGEVFGSVEVPSRREVFVVSQDPLMTEERINIKYNVFLLEGMEGENVDILP